MAKSSIRLDPADRHKVLIDVEVDSDLPVTRGTARSSMEGITGIAYVHLLDDSHETAPPPKGASGAWRSSALKPSFLDTVSDSAEGAVRDARELMAAVNAIRRRIESASGRARVAGEGRLESRDRHRQAAADDCTRR